MSNVTIEVFVCDNCGKTQENYPRNQPLTDPWFYIRTYGRSKNFSTFVDAHLCTFACLMSYMTVSEQEAYDRKSKNWRGLSQLKVHRVEQ